MHDDEDVLTTPMVQREMKRNEKLQKVENLRLHRKRRRLSPTRKIGTKNTINSNENNDLNSGKYNLKKRESPTMQPKSINDKATTTKCSANTLKKSKDISAQILTGNNCSKSLNLPVKEELSDKCDHQLSITSGNETAIKDTRSLLTTEQQQQISETDNFLNNMEHYFPVRIETAII